MKRKQNLSFNCSCARSRAPSLVVVRTLPLTATEYKLLETLGRSPGRVFTREEMLARAFGPGYDGLDRTVDVHITNLRRKVETGRRPKYILTAHGIGYRLVAPGDL